MKLPYSDSIISKIRKGTPDDPFVQIEETLIVDNNGKVVLKEYPTIFHGVQVKTLDGHELYEVHHNELTEDTYKVDYTNKYVTFHHSNVGKQFVFSFYGTGGVYSPASNIYVERHGTDIVETLQSLADTTKEARDTATSQGNYAKEQGDYANQKANELGVLIENTEYKGEYKSTSTYQKNNIVTYNGQSFISKVNNNKGQTPTGYSDDAYWALAAKKGEDGVGSVSIKKHVFIATAGQKVFVLPFTYQPNENKINVYVGGSVQTPENFEETNSTTITLSEGVEEGTKVIVEVFSTELDDRIEEYDQIVQGAIEATNYANEQADRAKSEADRLVNVDAAQFDERVTKVEEQLKDTERQTQTLTHGLNVINAEQNSPLKVEFYGNTLVNYIPNFNSNIWRYDSVFTVIDNKTLKLEIPVGSSVWRYAKAKIPASSDSYYVFKGTTNSDRFRINQYDSGDTLLQTDDAVNEYLKVSTLSNTAYFEVVLYSTFEGTFTFEEPILYKLTQQQADKIGVSLTDADVERMFPYVDGVQHVKNPVVRVSGKNLFDGQLEQGDISITTGEAKDSSSRMRSVNFIPVLPNATYTLTRSIPERNTGSRFYDKNRNYIGGSVLHSSSNGLTSVTFTTPANCYNMKFIDESNYINQKFQLELGDKATPFVDYNPSYLYAETTLAGNDNKKDILSYNESKGRWEKTKWWETDVVLDGSKNWAIHQSKTGHKSVQIPSFRPLNQFTKVIASKYDGKILNSELYTVDIVDNAYFVNTGALLVTISNSDSGWTDAMSPSADLIKSYFYGWKYVGDGTNHSWVSLVDGSEPLENTLAYCSTHMAEGFTPYKLTYQLAEPVIEEVQVEGDLIVSGQTQVKVGSEFTYVVDEEGKRTYTITPENERVGANLTEVKATYAKNVRSALDETVKKQSDIATEVTIHARSLVDLYVRLKALEGVE